MKLAKSVFTLLLAAHALPAANRIVTDLFPPDTKIVFGINLRQVINSPLAQATMAQAKDQVQAQLKSQAQAVDWL